MINNAYEYTQEEKELFRRALQDDIEMFLEDFEETTGNHVKAINIKRIPCDIQKDRKAFEYLVEVTIKKWIRY